MRVSRPLAIALLLTALASATPARALIFGTPCGARLPNAVAVIVDVEHVRDGAATRTVVASCSGAFVRADVVLTAAHCLDPRRLVGDDEVVAVSYAVSFADDLEFLADVPADAVVAVDRFVPAAFSFDALSAASGTDNELFDAALLFFDVAVVDDDGVGFVDDVGVDRAGSAFVTAGYGATDPTQILTSAGARTCGEGFYESVAAFEAQVGAGSGSLRACNGDSGGPIVVDVDGDAVLVGVHSHSLNEDGCLVPSVAARIAPLFALLDDAARAACVDGPRTACDPPGLLARPRPQVDAGVVDAGVVDAGVVDAGVDGPVLDGGVDDDDTAGRSGCAGCSPAILSLGLLRRRRRGGGGQR